MSILAGDIPGCSHPHEVLVARRGHVLEHVGLVEDDVVEVELAEEDAVVGRAGGNCIKIGLPGKLILR